MHRIALVFVLVACGDNRDVPDAAPAAPVPTPNLGPLVELGDLPPRDHAPFSQSLETSIAAHGDTVVVTYVNLGDADPSTYANDGDVDKRAAVAVSVDRGATFGAPFDPAITALPYATDPVVRTGPDGTFWMMHLGQVPGDDEIAVGRSPDGLAWQRVAGIPAADKEWFVVDESSIWLGYLPREAGTGYTRLALDGSVLAHGLPRFGGGAIGMYVDAEGMHVAHLSDSPSIPIARWNGTDPAIPDGERLVHGNEDLEAVAAYATTVSMGAMPERGQWIVRTVKRGDAPAIVLRIRYLPDEGVDLPISEPGAHAFLPAAIDDDDGRLRVVYYDTSGPTGVLRTTRSLFRDWTRGFEPSTIIDPEACPGERWIPTFVFGSNNEGGERRLREYIDLATTHRRIHVAFTHSPRSPSRAVATYFDY